MLVDEYFNVNVGGTGTREEVETALAAVERVRAIHYERKFTWPDRNTGEERFHLFCDHCGEWDAPGSWPCATLAALDGAPEPEPRYLTPAEVLALPAGSVVMTETEYRPIGHDGFPLNTGHGVEFREPNIEWGSAFHHKSERDVAYWEVRTVRVSSWSRV